MEYLSKYNLEIAKGIMYLFLGIILGLRAFNIIHATFVDYIIFIVATYFIGCGLYYAGLYQIIINFVQNKK